MHTSLPGTGISVNTNTENTPAHRAPQPISSQIQRSSGQLQRGVWQQSSTSVNNSGIRQADQNDSFYALMCGKLRVMVGVQY